MEIKGRTEVERLREQYPEGTRVELLSMEDPYSRIPEGARGTVAFVDDIGTVHVDWDSGARLGLVVGVDRFRKAAEMDDAVKGQILAVRDTGLVNMFDVRGVGQIAEAMGFTELKDFLGKDEAGYVRFILHGE